MNVKKYTKIEAERLQANLVAGERALARHSRRALQDRKRPPDGGEAVPAVSPKKPKPIIDGAEVPIR